MKESDELNHYSEQSQESISPSVKVSRADLKSVHPLASRLIDELRELPDGDIIGEIVANAIKLMRDSTNRGDLKLIDKSFKELRYALKVFAPYRDIRKVSIFGSARTPEADPDYLQAAAFGKAMAQAGWMVITGAGGGIMAAGHGGAGRDPSFGLAIRLPFEQRTNAFIENDPKLISFKYFFTRKLMFVRSSHAVAVFPGGFGTMDEGFEVLTLVQTGKSAPVPIVFIAAPDSQYWRQWQHYVQTQLLDRGLIGPSDLRLYKITESVEEATREITHFYSNYNSLRYVRDQLAIRLHRRPTPAQVETIAREFADICVSDGFQVSGPLAVESDEPALSHLHRLVFNFNRRDHGRLRILIDHLNDL